MFVSGSLANRVYLYFSLNFRLCLDKQAARPDRCHLRKKARVCLLICVRACVCVCERERERARERECVCVRARARVYVCVCECVCVCVFCGLVKNAETVRVQRPALTSPLTRAVKR